MIDIFPFTTSHRQRRSEVVHGNQDTYVGFNDPILYVLKSASSVTLLVSLTIRESCGWQQLGLHYREPFGSFGAWPLSSIRRMFQEKRETHSKDRPCTIPGAKQTGTVNTRSSFRQSQWVKIHISSRSIGYLISLFRTCALNLLISVLCDRSSDQ